MRCNNPKMNWYSNKETRSIDELSSKLRCPPCQEEMKYRQLQINTKS